MRKKYIFSQKCIFFAKKKNRKQIKKRCLPINTKFKIEIVKTAGSLLFTFNSYSFIFYSIQQSHIQGRCKR